MHKAATAFTLVLLAGCAGSGQTPAVAESGMGGGNPCPPGGSCQNMGGDTFSEAENLNQGLKSDSDEDLEAQAAKIRKQSQKDLDETIEKLEHRN